MAKQHYKSIYFSDHPSGTSKEKSITLAFSEKDIKTYFKIKDKSSTEIKEIIDIKTYQELAQLAINEGRSINQIIKRRIKRNIPEVDQIEGATEQDVTFFNSKNIPFQRWYPYIEGYSPDFVSSLIKDYHINNLLIYDPFAGTGTTVFTVDQFDMPSVYSEVNPLLQFLITTKIKVLKETQVRRQALALSLNTLSKELFNVLSKYSVSKQLHQSYCTVFGESIYFPKDTYKQILRLRTLIDQIKTQDTLVSDLLAIAVCSCLLSVSLLKKVGDVRFKTPKELEKGIVPLKDVLPQKLLEMSDDITNQSYHLRSNTEFIVANAKDIAGVHKLEIGAVITSPPYLNGTNYFRNTKIELWFLGFLKGENDLRGYRDQILTSGINDVKMSQAYNTDDIIKKSKILKSTLKMLNDKAYDKRIPIMVVSYFAEMHQIFNDLKVHLLDDAKILIDLGDSIFCGVHIKTDAILIEILKSLGYNLIDFKILRKRRSKNQEILSQVLIVFSYHKE